MKSNKILENLYFYHYYVFFYIVMKKKHWKKSLFTNKKSWCGKSEQHFHWKY